MSKIQWLQLHGYKPESWNPVTGCSRESAGCDNCFAKDWHARMTAMGVEKYQHPFSEVWLHRDTLDRPGRWTKPRMIFVNSMSDLFHPEVPFSFIDSVIHEAAINPRHIYVILTKRADRLAEWAEGRLKDGVYWLIGPKAQPRFWFGVTVENQQMADKRIPLLQQCGGDIKRIVSVEPQLGYVEIDRYMRGDRALSWVICGGESGPNARPMNPEWPRYLRLACQRNKVPFFFKQWGEWSPVSDNDKYASKVVGFNGLVSGVTREDVLRVHGDSDIPRGLVGMSRVGKKKAGRELDGAIYNEFPKL